MSFPASTASSKQSTTSWKLKFADGASLVFRAYDEGVAYRWETTFPGEIVVEDELAQFIFPGQPNSWFPEEESIFTHQERVYKYLPLAEIGPERFCSTGVLVDLKDGRKVYISESDLRSYPGMFLRGVGEGKVGLVGKYAPYALETQPKSDSPSDRDVPVTKAAPYLAKTAGHAVLPLASDPRHRKGHRAYPVGNHFQSGGAARPRRHFLDQARQGHLGLVERHQCDGRRFPRRSQHRHVQVLHRLCRRLRHRVFADRRRLVRRFERRLQRESQRRHLKKSSTTARRRMSGSCCGCLWNGLDKKLDAALAKFEKMGVAGIKVDFMQRDDQWMVDFYERVAREAAAKHHLLVDFHGAYKPTGLRREFPNVMTREGVTGMEQYKWGDQNDKSRAGTRAALHAHGRGPDGLHARGADQRQQGKLALERRPADERGHSLPSIGDVCRLRKSAANALPIVPRATARKPTA